MFEVGRDHDRRREIREPYGGQRQGGISSPANRSFVFLFTGETGEQHGYGDGWDQNGDFLYAGEGQVGSMAFTPGNRAVRDRVMNGKDLHPFKSLGKRKRYRCPGMFACSAQADQSKPQEAKGHFYKRCDTVRQYLLARAGGIRGSCGRPAPFLRINGTPYLEPHHTRRISDGGPDYPRWVAAICPNCHQEIHHAKDRKERNQHLQQYLALLEE